MKLFTNKIFVTRLLLLFSFDFFLIVFVSCSNTKVGTPKVVDFAVKNLRQKMVSPSSFKVDSTKVLIGLTENNKTVEIYYESKNRLGVLLQGVGVYRINEDTVNGSYSIESFEHFDNYKEYHDHEMNEIFKDLHLR